MDDLLELTGRAEATHFWFRGFRKFIAPVIADVVKGRPGLRLVDCGCGTGHNLQLLRPHGRALGFDLSEAGPARAHATGLTVLRGDVTRIPLASTSFDVATSFDVLQCVDADVAAVREMARIIKPGGVVILTLAALDVLHGDHAGERATSGRIGGSYSRTRLVPVRVAVSVDGVSPPRPAHDAAVRTNGARGHGYHRANRTAQSAVDDVSERRSGARQTRADADRQFVVGGCAEGIVVPGPRSFVLGPS
jgi:SAM-dependent methyltransferase